MDDDAQKEVPKFHYVGSVFTEYGKNKEDIIKRINPLNAKLNPICHLLALLGAHHILHVSRVRVNETKVMFNDREKLLCSNNLILKIKKKSIKSFIWSVALYWSETWTLGKNEEKS